MKKNVFLIVGGILSLLASALHIGVVIGGSDWYRFFGAGEEMASLDAAGSLYPAIITILIALVLLVWALYAFSGAGLIRRLPLIKLALVVISAIYLVRGLALFPAYLFAPQLVDAFMVWSSLICLAYGGFYAIGTRQVWRSFN